MKNVKTLGAGVKFFSDQYDKQQLSPFMSRRALHKLFVLDGTVVR